MSKRLTLLSGSHSIRMSISLSGRKRSVRMEPNRDSFRMRFRRQNSPISSWDIANGGAFTAGMSLSSQHIHRIRRKIDAEHISFGGEDVVTDIFGNDTTTIGSNGRSDPKLGAEPQYHRVSGNLGAPQ